MEEHAAALADAIERTLPAWVERSVERVVRAWRGELDDDVARAAAAAGRQAAEEVGPQVRTLLDTDIDAQRTTPLSLVRGAVRYPSAVLQAASRPSPPRPSAPRTA